MVHGGSSRLLSLGRIPPHSILPFEPLAPISEQLNRRMNPVDVASKFGILGRLRFG